jgi:hypothetical protein
MGMVGGTLMRMTGDMYCGQGLILPCRCRGLLAKDGLSADESIQLTIRLRKEEEGQTVRDD